MVKYYCEAVLNKLKQQSDILRDLPITIELTRMVANASVSAAENKIKINPNYIHERSSAAPTISHELAHIVYYRLYGFLSNKEDEIFADVYGMILCKRAGCSVAEVRDDWNDELRKREYPNDDAHPENKIRYYILKRAMAYLDDLPNVEIKNPKIPERNGFEESPFDVSLRRQRIKQKHHFNEDGTRSEQPNTTDVLNPDLTANQFKREILMSNLLGLAQESLYSVGTRVLGEKSLAEDYPVLEKVHNTLTQAAFEDADPWLLKKIIPPYEEKIMTQLENIRQTQDAPAFGECVEQFLWHKNRFMSAQHRKQLQKWYIENLLKQCGCDDGSERFTANLNNALNKLNHRLHNADVLPLLRDIKNALKVQDRNIPLLQTFARDNEQETKQIRSETLITECLLNSEQALKTVQYLSDAKKEPFCYEKFYGNYWYNDYTRRDEPLIEKSLINEETLREICEDMMTVSPRKRAEIFCLLMENISPKNNMHKLELFVNKTTEKDSLYKTLVEEYIKTYEPDQQPYVIASLVSKKNRNRDYSYEDYFKTILQNSGIDGIRTYNALYPQKIPEEIVSLDTNRTALHAKDMIIFANLRKLGQKTIYHADTNLRKIGQQIVQATRNSIARPLLNRQNPKNY